MKKRIDVFLVDKGFFESREKAKQFIRWGKIHCDGKIVEKPSKKVDESSEIEIRADKEYVSRAGYKLKKALETFELDVRGSVCLDVGSSTGGFVDCLLQEGVKKVYALEVSKNQLHKKLEKDLRVVNLEGISVMENQIPVKERIDFCSIDVGFLSLRNILPKLKKYFNKETEIVALFKPPYEVKKGSKRMKIYKKDILRALDEFSTWCGENGFRFIDHVKSPIEGKRSKQMEFLVYLKTT